MAAAQLVWGAAQAGNKPGALRGVWGTPPLPSPHAVLQLPCTYPAPPGATLLPPPPGLLAQPVTAAYALPPLLLPGPVLCSPCLGLPRAKVAPSRDSTRALKAWLGQHVRNPYPSKGEKLLLAVLSQMSLTQVSTWFANARRRLRKEKQPSWAVPSASDGAASEGETRRHQQPRTQGQGPGGSPGAGGSPKGGRPDPCLESAQPSPPSVRTAGLTQEMQPRLWCLAELATCPRQDQSCRPWLEVTAPCGGPGGATCVLPPQLSLARPWHTESHQPLPL